ncbi:MAG: hypothetical protein Q4P28_03915 [Tissierellia bacterium]|nr:hypothetical protein [Tissierellia bacterium]
MKKIILILSLLLLVSCMNDVPENAEKPPKTVENPSKSEENPPEQKVALRPMVMVDGKIYLDTGYVNSYATCGTADGEIKTTVDPTEKPKQNDESNFGTDYEYQRWTEGALNVMMDHHWVIFVTEEYDRDIPFGVANLKAEIMKIDMDKIMVRILEFPEEESTYAFQENDVEKLKPLWLPVDKIIEVEKIDDHIVGKKIHVYFYGVKNENMATSAPMELVEVYRIEIIEG